MKKIFVVVLFLGVVVSSSYGQLVKTPLPIVYKLEKGVFTLDGLHASFVKDVYGILLDGCIIKIMKKHPMSSWDTSKEEAESFYYQGKKGRLPSKEQGIEFYQSMQKRLIFYFLP